jgi:predicted enzyme related to lactoylglutathione lyase
MKLMLRLLVNIDVTDIERAVAFYTEAFALTAGRRFRNDCSVPRRRRSWG